MKLEHISLVPLSIAAALLLAACGGESDPSASGGGDTSGGVVTAVTITGNDVMQFDTKEFTVAAGTEITLTLKNIGQMPKLAMGHNLAILDKDADPMAFATAALQAAETEYIPEEYKNQVIAATKVLGPGEEEVITFTAPSEPGDYHYVCSFPGHTPAGMRGIMRVK